MKSKGLSIVLVLMVLAGVAVGQTAAAATSPAPAIRILSPKPGESVNQSALTVQFQLENPGLAAGGFPNYSIQLDNRDPVVTAQTSQNFTGLAPGSHTAVVQLVDANGTPVSGTRTELQFSVTASAAQPQPGRPPATVSADLPQNDAVLTDQGETLPAASSALPLLSVIGFGALVGGVISALRTR